MLASNSVTRSPVVIALFMGLALVGCAKKDKLPDNSGQLGLNNGAAPGSQQDFTVNVGDRVNRLYHPDANFSSDA